MNENDWQTTFRILEAENEHLRERVAWLMLEEPSKTQGLYAAIDELQRRTEGDTCCGICAERCRLAEIRGET